MKNRVSSKWVVPRSGKGGGLVLFWKYSINLKVEDSNKYFIDTSTNKNTDKEWRFTGFYGEQETHKRVEA